MRKCVFVALLISLSFAGWAQKKKKSEKQEPAKEQAPPVQQAQTAAQPQDTVPQISPALRHYAMKYSLAVRWSDQEAAKDALYDLIVENPGNDSIIYELALYYFQAQKYAPSVLVCQELLKRNPKNTSALQISGIGYESLGVPDRALQSYESLFLLQNDLGILYKMSFLQLQLKRFKESETSVDILLANPKTEGLKINYGSGAKMKEYPMKVALLNLKGMIAQEQGDKVTAKKYYDQALAQAPDFTMAKDNIAKLK